MTDQLVAFLRERLDEDEQIARAASGGEIEAVEYLWETKYLNVRRPDGTVTQTAEFSAELADHIARYDPARVLAEIDAKRRILDEHSIVHRNIGWLANGEEEYAEVPVCGTCIPKHAGYRSRDAVPVGCCITVRFLALPYAGHEGFREEWRP